LSQKSILPQDKNFGMAQSASALFEG